MLQAWHVNANRIVGTPRSCDSHRHAASIAPDEMMTAFGGRVLQLHETVLVRAGSWNFYAVRVGWIRGAAGFAAPRWNELNRDAHCRP
jgi:hypothetical protein